jgi:hypothetical protein
MSKAFLDTTVLTDALLKTTEQRRRARGSFERFETVQVPFYAIKEFKAGPLRAYMWLHNRVVTTNSWSQAIGNAGGVARQHNLSATAIQGVAEFTSSMGRSAVKDLAAKYPDLTLEELQQREATVWLRTKIFSAWRKRNRTPLSVTSPLSCYAEIDPRVKANGLIDYTPIKCGLDYCCLRQQFADAKSHTKALAEVCRASPKPEMRKRGKVLRGIARSPNRALSENECRKLGDAVFALQCPEDAVILTTNVADHVPLASSIGKNAEAP